MKGNTLGDLGITHGHLLYVNYKEQVASVGKEETASVAAGDAAPTSAGQAETDVAGPSAAGKKTLPQRPWETVREDPVDVFWNGKDGMISRPKDSKFCRHGDKAMCDYCMPLEPYDAKYHAEHNIKHSSFHAYLKKLDVATNASKPSQTYIPPLEEPNYSVRVPCPSGQHPSWPAGICTKCQPSAITLQSQEFRVVDHVEFSHPQLIENLLAFWRSTGVQRYGFLLGHYEPYEVVPMGIKAVVEAIHEPPQEGETDGLTLGVPWEDQARVEKLASACGLQVVGQIYTDLTPADPTFQDPTKAGMVLCKRHKDSFFLSSLEAAFSAHLQAANPNPSRYSMSGRYGSKFVTCVLSGTEEGAIDVSAYQISEQGVGMVKSDMIEASVAPGIVRVKPSEGERYVPEVFYRYKNEYGIQVKESAKPTFPVEYLLVTLTHGFPNVPSPRFLAMNPFAIENRPGLHDQDLNKALAAIAKAIGQDDLVPTSNSQAAGQDVKLKKEKLLGVISDWHLLAFLDGTGLLDADDMQALCRAAVTHDSGSAIDTLISRPGWQNLSAIARANGVTSTNGGKAGSEEVMGDFAADDYIPPEAMEGYTGGSSADAGKTSSNTAAPSGSSQTQRGTASRSTATMPAVKDDFTYTGSDDEEDVDFEDVVDDDDDEDNDGGHDFDDAFDDASSSLSAEQRPATTTRSAPAPSTSTAPPSRPAAPPSPPAPASSGGVACPHCTFENAAGSVDCDVCGLPLSG